MPTTRSNWPAISPSASCACTTRRDPRRSSRLSTISAPTNAASRSSGSRYLPSATRSSSIPNADSATGSTAMICAGRAPAAELARPLMLSLDDVATTYGASSGDANASSTARRTSAGKRSSIRRRTRNSGRSTVTWPVPSRTPESIHCSWLPSPKLSEKISRPPPMIMADAVSSVRRSCRRRLRIASTTRTPACISQCAP